MTSLNFNDLPSDIQSLAFHQLTPLERAYVLPTCQEWYQLIMGTRGYWKDLEVGRDCSFQRLMEMLQAFTARSQNSMRSIIIDKRIEYEVELQRIFDVVTLSSSTVRMQRILDVVTLSSPTVKILSIRAEPFLRQLARSLPNLHFLRFYFFQPFGYTPRLPEFSPSGSQNGLSHYETHSLSDVQEDEMEWLSHLVTLTVLRTFSAKNILPILRRNTSTLKSLDWTFVEKLENQALDPLLFEVLSRLSLPARSLERAALILPLAAPNLIALRGRISQLQAVVSPSVIHLGIYFEEESQVWIANQSDTFLREIEGVFSQFPLIETLIIQAPSGAYPVQLKMVLEALHRFNERPPVPHLQRLIIDHNTTMIEIESLLDLFIKRQEYMSKMGENEEFRIEILGVGENQLLFDEALRRRQGN